MSHTSDVAAAPVDLEAAIGSITHVLRTVAEGDHSTRVSRSYNGQPRDVLGLG